MSGWDICDGVISLKRANGEVCFPSASELLSQLESSQFDYLGEKFSPVGELPFRISKIGINHVIINFEQSDGLALNLWVEKRGVRYKIPFVQSQRLFVDYAFFNNACYPVYGCLSSINDSISRLCIEPSNISYAQYMQLSRLIEEAGFSIEDDGIKNNLDDIRENETLMVETNGLKADLFPYQKSGLNWLSYMVDHGCGCILGDEMGLGKTLQIIATIGYYKETRGRVHCLVVCPVSLLENWRREIAKFYPSLNVCVNHGKDRYCFYASLLPFDVVVISYSSLQPDCAMLQMIEWDLVVIDEAQNVKNPKALRTQYLKKLERKTAIAVSGTPFENHMTDVWSLVDFVLPGYLGKLSEFEAIYGDDIHSAEQLEKIISPIIIRRKVKDVGKSLPPRIDVPVPIVMTQEEAMYYEGGRDAAEKDFGLTDTSLDKIQKLRMFCTHPFVYDSSLPKQDPSTVSNKYSRLCEILEEIFSYKEKAIVFTSFSKMIQLIVEDIHQRFGVYTNFIDGSVDSAKRQQVVDDFSSANGAALLVLNPNAAGTGLNITAANHVIHYNLEWNPAKEDQASARAHRTGQTKTVVVHRLFYVDTIEEFINEKIQQKRAVSDSVIKGTVGDDDSKRQLLEVLRKTPYKIEK